VDIKIVRQINIFAFPMKNLIVSNIKDQQVEGVGKFHNVSLQVQDLNLQTGCYTRPLYVMDMVLGEEWLMQLGTYTTNLQE